MRKPHMAPHPYYNTQTNPCNPLIYTSVAPVTTGPSPPLHPHQILLSETHSSLWERRAGKAGMWRPASLTC